MTKILARKKNGKKCQSVTGFKNVEGVLSKHLNRGFVVLCALYHSRRRHARERIHFLKNRLEPQHYIGSLLMMMILWFSFLFFSNLALVQ